MILDQMLGMIREAGWAVGVHNDYKLAGRGWTFWLFTHPDGRYVKAEAQTDAMALQQIIDALGLR